MNWQTEYKILTIKDPGVEAITTPSKVFDMVKNDFSPISESMYLLSLNVKNQIIEKHLIAKGSYNSLISTPADIFRPLLINGGNNFILAHNHPSGDINPSEEDIIFTTKIIKVSGIMGCSFLDHIIFSDKEYYSFKKNNLI